jgi:hypothetical protein
MCSAQLTRIGFNFEFPKSEDNSEICPLNNENRRTDAIKEGIAPRNERRNKRFFHGISRDEFPGSKTSHDAEMPLLSCRRIPAREDFPSGKTAQ